MAAAERPDVVFVLDKSGSMWFGIFSFMGQNMTRWRSLYLTVQSVVEKFDGQADFGAELFPEKSEVDICAADNPITAPVAPMNAAALMASLPGPDDIVAGSTPMGEGLQIAFAHLDAIRQAGKPQAVILVADGGVSVSCGSPNTPEEVVDMVSNAWADGVPTYVVGVDANTTALSDQLNAIAVAGGQPLPGVEKFYNAQDGDALLAKFEEIVDGVLTCTIDLGKEPDFPAFTKVSVGGMELPEITECNLEDGWIWSAEYDQITLCGSACEDLKASGTVNVEFLCPEG